MTDWEAELNATRPDAPPEAEPPPDADAAARELAKLSALEYEQVREGAAKRLKVRVRALDEAVQRYRDSGKAEEDTNAAPFAEPEPWAERVDGAVLLDDIVSVFRRYVVMPEHSAEAAALWCLHAHAHDAAEISPILAILSPTMQCGKTTTTKVVAAIVPKPMHAINCTESVLFRVVEQFKPTVLIDEGDTFLKDNDGLRGLLNGGHDRQSAYVWRSVGDDHEPKQFKVWAPKTIAMIGRLPPTLTDRSVIVLLRRRRGDETVERFRSGLIDATLAMKASRWAADHAIGLASADPDLPDDLDDRARDNWRPLVAIADAVGGDWPKIARAAARVLTSDEVRGDSLPPALRLLADMRTIMDGLREITSMMLVEKLLLLDDGTYAEWKHGKPITAAGVARLLKPYGIKPYRGAGASVYRVEDLADAWSRYLDNSEGLAPETKCESAKCEPSASKKSNDNNDFRTFADTRTSTEARTSKCEELSPDLAEPDDNPPADAVAEVLADHEEANDPYSPRAWS